MVIPFLLLPAVSTVAVPTTKSDDGNDEIDLDDDTMILPVFGFSGITTGAAYPIISLGILLMLRLLLLITLLAVQEFCLTCVFRAVAGAEDGGTGTALIATGRKHDPTILLLVPIIEPPAVAPLVLLRLDAD